jgi:23S rRNA pseudouridine1911/1915/1917 synthase
MKEHIPEALAGERVDRVVAMLTGLPRSAVAELVASGGVRLAGSTVTSRSTRVSAGVEVDVDVPVPPVEGHDPAPAPEVHVEVVHADDDVLVVDKAAGVVVHPGAGNPDGTLAQALLARFPELAGVGQPGRPGVVHRLDKGTSGLLVVARTAYDALVAQLAARQVGRRYLALVWGCPQPANGLVDAPVGRSRRDPTRMTVSSQGREARTSYEVLRPFHDPVVVSLVACQLETGRTHQIRVHLAAIGHPVVGDGRYGGDRVPLRSARPFLHAERLSFCHPATGERLTFESPLPTDLEEVLAELS